MGSCLSKNEVARNQVAPEVDYDTEYLGQHGYRRYLKSRSGLELSAYFWPADDGVPFKGIVQLSHGSAAHTCFDYLRFKGPGKPSVYEGSWVAALNRAGFAVCGLDHAGYGRSKGPRGQLGRMQEHVDNLLLLTDFVSEQGGASFPGGRPHFLLGHSMGGLAATLAAAQQPGRFSGLVLLAPTLALPPEAAGQDAKDPKAAEAEVPWIHEAWKADPLVHEGGSRSRQYDELRGATSALCGEGGMEGVALPLLVFQSERDTRAQPEGASMLHQRATTADKTLRLLQRQWHVLTQEEGWEELLEETVGWLTARAANHGGLTRGPLSEPGQGHPDPAGARVSREQSQAEQAGPGAGQPEVEAVPQAGGGGNGDADLPGAAVGDAAHAESPQEGGKAEAGGQAAAGGGAAQEGEAPGASDTAAGDGAGSEAGGPGDTEVGAASAGGAAAEAEPEPEAPTAVLTRSMSVLARAPQPGGGPLGRGHSFSGKAGGSELSASAASGLSLLGPLPPLRPRRSLGDPASFGAFPGRPLTARSRLPPLEARLLDKKPAA